jgi:hypothetical protein
VQIPSQVENVDLALTGAVAADRIGVPVLTSASPPVYRRTADQGGSGTYRRAGQTLHTGHF